MSPKGAGVSEHTHKKLLKFWHCSEGGGGVQGLPKLFWALFYWGGNCLVFTHAPCGVWVFRWTFSPPLSSHLQLFIPTRPKKAQVLFLSGREKLKFLFLLGTENAVGGCGSLAVYAIVFFFYRCTTGVLCVISLQFICFSLNKHGIDI